MHDAGSKELSLHQDCSQHPPGYDLHQAAAAGLLHVYEGLSGSFASMATQSNLGKPTAVSISHLLSLQQHLESVTSTAPPPDVGNDILAQLRGSVKTRINSCWSVEAVKQGVVHAKGGNHQEAASCYAKALELDPSNSDAFVARGALQANRKHLQEAAADFEKALALKPENINARKYLDAVRTKQQQQLEEVEEGEQFDQQAKTQEQQRQRPTSSPSPPPRHNATAHTAPVDQHHRPREHDERSDSLGKKEDRYTHPEQHRGHDYRHRRQASTEEGQMRDRNASPMGRPSDSRHHYSNPEYEASEEHEHGHRERSRSREPREGLRNSERINAESGSDGGLRETREQSPDQKLHRSHSHSRSRSREEPQRLDGKGKKGSGHKDRDGNSRGKHKKEKTKKKHRRSNS